MSDGASDDVAFVHLNGPRGVAYLRFEDAAKKLKAANDAFQVAQLEYREAMEALTRLAAGTAVATEP